MIPFVTILLPEIVAMVGHRPMDDSRGYQISTLDGTVLAFTALASFAAALQKEIEKHYTRGELRRVGGTGDRTRHRAPLRAAVW